MNSDGNTISSIHKRYLIEQQNLVADKIIAFLTDSHNTGIKKKDLPEIEVYLKGLQLTEPDDVECYLDVLTETELTDNESVVSELSEIIYSDVGESDLSEDEEYGAMFL